MLTAIERITASVMLCEADHAVLENMYDEVDMTIDVFEKNSLNEEDLGYE